MRSGFELGALSFSGVNLAMCDLEHAHDRVVPLRCLTCGNPRTVKNGRGWIRAEAVTVFVSCEACGSGQQHLVTSAPLDHRPMNGRFPAKHFRVHALKPLT